MFGGTAATKSTLVKRGAKDENAESHPSKRVKVDGEDIDLTNINTVDRGRS
jgi:hypothetical protein